jgi:hypothetical protein
MFSCSWTDLALSEPAKEYFAGSEPVITAITVGASALESFGQTAAAIAPMALLLDAASRLNR